MKRYRKRPVEIEALQYLGYRNADEVTQWIESNGGETRIAPGIDGGHSTLVIKTPDGEVKVNWGDWIIKDVKFQPCNRDTFNKTYEEVNR
ncbi:MAG: hypothetical protein LBT46_15435 [Planctomycetaceae bacterium]|nr:hypothetical protein [Planctomycetaceae bacterium]